MEKCQSTMKDQIDALQKSLEDVAINIYYVQTFCDLATNNILPDMGNSSEVNYMFAIAAATLNCCNEIENVYSVMFHGLNEICDEIEKRQGVTV